MSFSRDILPPSVPDDVMDEFKKGFEYALMYGVEIYKMTPDGVARFMTMRQFVDEVTNETH